jgi:hypothetical protein
MTKTEQIYLDYSKAQEYLEEAQEALLRHEECLLNLDDGDEQNAYVEMRKKMLLHDQELIRNDIKELKDDLEMMEEMYGECINYYENGEE